MINTILRFIGVPPILAYLAMAALCVALVFGYGAREYYKGRAAGTTVERAAWVAQRAKDQAALDAAKQAAQDAIDALSNERQLAAQEAKDRQADADLAAAQAASPSKKALCLPRKVVRALNNIGK